MTAAPVGLRCSRSEEDQKTVGATVFPTNAIRFCLTIKVLFKLPLRQTTGMVASLLRMADLNRAMPGYTTLCRRQKTLADQIPYRRADGPFNLLVDIEPWKSFKIRFADIQRIYGRRDRFPQASTSGFAAEVCLILCKSVK